jgi:hypothetical protein
MKLYKTQTDLTISVNTGKDLSSVSSVVLRYINPLNVEGEFEAEVADPAEDGVVKYETPTDSPIGIAGVWKFWVKVVYSSGAIGVGEPFNIRFYNEGDV